MSEVGDLLLAPPEPPVRPGPAVLQVLPRLDYGGIECATVDLASHPVERGWRTLVASNAGWRGGTPGVGSALLPAARCTPGIR
jgi:hypothetical protein